MSSSSANFISLIESLEFLRNDHRLARVFSSNSSDTCNLTLWLLEIRQGDIREYRLIYGWVIPRMPRNLNQWFQKSLFEYKVSPFTFQMYRLTFHHLGKTIFDLVKELCKGTSLEKSCQQLEFAIPVKANQIHPCSQFSLAKSSQELSQLYTVRPVTFVKPAWHHLSEIDDLKPVSSPNEAVPAFIGSLNRLGKLNLFQMDKLQQSQQDELAKRCFSTLREETGLDFCGVDSKRLGNLEWLCFPAADTYERSEVGISFDSPAYTVIIEIPSGTLSIGTQATIRCRLYNDREISLDCLRTIQILDSTVSLSFTSQQEITKYLVTIWIKLQPGDTEEIWYESTAPMLKQLNINQGLVGFQAGLTSDWLKEAGKSNKLKKKVEQAQIVRQAHYQEQIISQYKPSSWIVEGQQVYSLAKRLFSKSSGGLFIKNGWGSDVQEPGIFTFFKWLKSVTDDGSASKVLITDPYFDESGIAEVIARVGAVQAEYVVLCNTQANSSYPEDASLEREPARAKRLKKICSRTDIDFLLSKLKFKLLDLRSLTEKKDQLFHDRYILVYGNQEEVKAGYHLSNSIQGATKDHPLLITPIPSDILTNVEEYVSKELLNPPSNKGYSVITLFSSSRLVEPLSKNLPEATEIPHASLLFSEIFQNKGFLSLSDTDLYQTLKSYGKLEDNLGSFQFQENKEAECYFNHLMQVLLVADLDTFIKLWVALFSWLSQTEHSDDYLNQFLLDGQSKLEDKLQKILTEIPSRSTLSAQSFNSSTHLEAAILADLVQLDFPVAIQKSDELLRLAGWREFSSCSQDNGIRYMAQVLIKLDPEKLVNTISELTKTSLAIPNDEANSLKLWNFRHTITFILKQVVDDVLARSFGHERDKHLLSHLLKSDIPFVRAVAARCFAFGCHSRSRSSEIFSVISVLPPLERLYVLAEWIFELRSKANFQNHRENEELKQLRIEIFNQMHECFPENLSQEELYSIIRRLSGIGEGDWSISITEDFIVPLLNDGRLPIRQVTEFWLSLLIRKLTGHIDLQTNKQDTQEHEVADPTFHGSDGLELIHVCVWAIVHSDADRRIFWLGKLSSLWNRTQGILAQPFLRYREYKSWYQASLCLLWLALLTRLLMQSEDLDESSKQSMLPFSELIDNILDATFEENPLPLKQWLWNIASNSSN